MSKKRIQNKKAKKKILPLQSANRSVSVGEKSRIGSIQTGENNYYIENLHVETESTDIRFNRSLFSLTRAQNVNFVGRSSTLQEIKTNFQNGQPRVALVGLGGIGKTQIALQFAHKYQSEFNIVFWIESTSEEAVEIAFRKLAKAIGVPETTQVFDDIFDETTRRLQEFGRWLLVFNDAQNIEIIRKFVPNLSNGRVLVTSRNQDWSAFAKPIKISGFDHEDALAFINLRTKTDDEVIATQLTRCLHSLPLALEQACAYIVRANKTIEAYVKLFETKRLELFGESPLDYEKTVRTTWEVSSGELAAQSPAAMQFISVCAIFAESDIELEWLNNEIHLSPLAEVMLDEMQRDSMIATLLSYSLIEFTEPEVFSIHALLQEVVQRSWNDNEAANFASQALVTIGWKFLKLNVDRVDCWPDCSKLLPHVFSTLNYLARIGFLNRGLAISLMVASGQYLYIRGYLSLSLPLLEIAAAEMQNITGASHESLSNCLNALAVIYRELDRYDDALPLAEEAIRLREEKFGKDSKEVIVSLNNLSVIKHCLGDYSGAEKLFQQAIEIARLLSKDNKEDLLSPLANLANLYLETGQAAKGLPLIEESYAICEEFLSTKPHLLAGAGGLMADYYRQTGNVARAISCLKESLKAKLRVYGLQNAVVATALNNMGVLYMDAKYYRPALSLFSLSLKLRESIFPSNHSTIAESYGQLGANYQLLDWRIQAEIAFKKSIQIYRAIRNGKTVRGETIVLRNYAGLLRKLNRQSEAQRCEDEANQIETRKT